MHVPQPEAVASPASFDKQANDYFARWKQGKINGQRQYAWGLEAQEEEVKSRF